MHVVTHAHNLVYRQTHTPTLTQTHTLMIIEHFLLQDCFHSCLHCLLVLGAKQVCVSEHITLIPAHTSSSWPQPTPPPRPHFSHYSAHLANNTQIAYMNMSHSINLMSGSYITTFPKMPCSWQASRWCERISLLGCPHFFFFTWRGFNFFSDQKY